jgi:HEAT repeat protein
VPLSPGQLLEQAQIAASSGDWATVSNCLQSLLHGSPQKRLGPSIGADREVLLSLACQGLTGGDFQVRWEIAKLLPSFDAAAIGPLTALLQDPAAAPEVQWFVIRILGQIPHPAVIPALVKVLETATDAELHNMTIAVLASLGDPAIATLGNLLQQPEQRQLVTQALAQIRQPTTIPWLLAVVRDADPAVRTEAIAALGHFRDPEVLPLLLAALSDPVATVRQAAVTALGFWATLDPPGDIVAHLQPRLGDEDLTVCQTTATALSRWGNDRAIAALAQVLALPQTPEPLLLEIVRALSWIKQAQALSHLQQALQLPLPERIIHEILLRLGWIEQPELKPQANQILLEVLQQPPQFAQSPIAHQTIALALGQLGQPSALDPLIQLLAEPTESVRFHVIAALKALDRALDAPIAYDRLQQIQDVNADPHLHQGISIALQEW